MDCGQQVRVKERQASVGFSLIELLAAASIFVVMVALLADAMSVMARTWTRGEARVDRTREARAALELFTREIKPAIVDTKMQFVVMPGELLQNKGDEHIAPNSMAALWMAPLGERNQLHCVGYYLHRDVERNNYLLKRVLIGPRWADDSENEYFPALVNRSDLRNRSSFKEESISPVDADWFFRKWDDKTLTSLNKQDREKTVTATVAGNVIAFWIQCYDLLGNPIPWVSASSNHPESPLIFNSASYFTMATSLPFDGGDSFRYRALEGVTTMRANRVPASVEARIVTLDRSQILSGLEIPEPSPVESSGEGAFLLDETINAFIDQLGGAGIQGYNVHSARVKLLNGN